MGFSRTTAINKIAALTKRVKVIPGGTSAGKTYGILPLLINKACQIPNLEISVVSESVPHLKRGALRDFLKIMRATNRFVESRYHKTDRTYTFGNGSYIEFFSPESILGARRDILYMNECNNMSFKDYHQLSIRTKKEVFLDYNPAEEFWADTEVIPDPDTDHLILTYKDNEALDPAIIKELEKARDKGYHDTLGDLDDPENIKDSYWANWWKVYGLGLVGTLEGVIFGSFESVDEFPEDCKWMGYGLDFGYTNDPSALTKVGLKGGKIYLQNLIYQTGLTNPMIAEKLSELGITHDEIVADSAEPKTIAELQQYGFNIIPAEKGPDSIKQGIDVMKRYDFCIVSSSLDLIREWRGYSWMYDKKTNKYLNIPIGVLNHCIDGIRYFIQYKVKPGTEAPRRTTLIGKK